MVVMGAPELIGFLGKLGMSWPSINEDELRKDAAAWRAVQAGAASAGADADMTVRRTQQVYRGESATAMADHWNRVGGDGGHVTQAAAASRTAPAVLDGTANVVSAVKVAVATQAAAGLTSVVQTLALGGALGVPLAAARMYSTRHAVGRVLREGAEGTGGHLAQALSRRVTDEMRRVLQDMRGLRPGGPEFAGIPRGAISAPSPVPRVPTGSRSVRDGIAAMGRRSPKRGGGGRGKPDYDAKYGEGHMDSSRMKYHGRLPDPNNLSKAEAEALKRDLEESVKTRQIAQALHGREAGHAARMREEKRTIEEINRKFGLG